MNTMQKVVIGCAILAVLLAGCSKGPAYQPPAGPSSTDSAVSGLGNDLSDLDSMDSDLNSSDLDSLDQDFAALG